MKKQQIFISSVQKELATERRAIRDFIRCDALFGQYFDVFLFEDLPAADRRADETYLDEVSASAIYLGLFANDYGSTDDKGISPTEHEFDRATDDSIYRLAFIRGSDDSKRAPAMKKLIGKVSNQLRRRRFDTSEALFLANYIDKAGTGVLDVLSQCKAAGLPEPGFAQDGDQFTVTLWRDALTPARLDQLGLNERQRKAIGLLRKKPRLTNTDYQEINAIARTTAKRDLEELVQWGLLELVGSGRGAHYRLTGKRSVNGPNGPTAHDSANGPQMAQMARPPADPAETGGANPVAKATRKEEK